MRSCPADCDLHMADGQTDLENFDADTTLALSRLAWLVVLAASSRRCRLPCTAAADLRIAQDASTVSIFDGNRPVLRYRYADVPKKPYADQLFSPAGVQVLRDSPNDHKHHHGLMYALAVDGVNFWEEHLPNSGRERHIAERRKGDGPRRHRLRRLRRRTRLDGAGLGQAAAGRAAGNRRAQGSDLGATLIQWRCRLQTPPGKDAIVLAGNPYFGLGMRFLTSMDKGGRFFNADDNPGDAPRQRPAADAHKMVRLHGQGRRQPGHRGHLRPSCQPSPSGDNVHHDPAVSPTSRPP